MILKSVLQIVHFMNRITQTSYYTLDKKEKQMQNFIINPQIFYWVNVLGILQTVFAILGGTCVTAFICLAIGWVVNACEVEKGYTSNSIYVKTCKKWTIITGILGLVLVIVSIFIPGRTTCIEMIIAKTATFDNVDWTVQQVKDIVDYIINAIKSV